MNTPEFPNLSLNERFALMDVPDSGAVPAVIDTDTYNEIDDQFAISWALLHPERLCVEALYAAPFTNNFFAQSEAGNCISDPKLGMELSLEEISRVLDMLPSANRPPEFSGSTQYLKDSAQPFESPAVMDLIERAMGHSGTLNVVCIAAPTNIANALVLEPELVKKIHVIWLGGHCFSWHNTEEFNLMQDIAASRIVLDSGVPLTLIPCMGVANTLATSVPEMQFYLANTSKIGCYLSDAAPNCEWIGFASRKVIWDIANIGYLLNRDWYTSEIVSSPVLNDNLTWSFNIKRHPIRVIKYIERDMLFKDMFRALIDADQ